MSLSRRHALAAALPLPALAQTGRPLTLVVAYPAGGDTDAMARLVAERRAPRLNRRVVVENRSGASGAVGSLHVSRAAPDGDTLLFAPSTFPIVPHVLRRGANYDPLRDFAPVAMIATGPMILIASRQSGIRTLGDVVAQARAGTLAEYGSPGSGSPMHIFGEMFNRAAGLRQNEVAYRGVAPVVNDLLAGVLKIGLVTPGAVAEHLRANTLVPVAVTEAARFPLLPAVPTYREAGFDLDVTVWWGLYGPPALPAPYVAEVNAKVNEVLALPDVGERFRTLGAVPAPGAPALLVQWTRGDWERFGRLVRELGIQTE